MTSDYTYNANTLRLSNILTKKPDGTTKLQDLSYSFDPNGNVSQISDTVNSMSQSFTYDDLNRLIQAQGSAYGTQSFSYDSIGNMTNKAGRVMNYGEGAPGPHALTSLSWTGSNYPTFCRDYQSGGCGMAYDANGNMTVRGQDILSYDSENRLTEMKVREGQAGTTNYTLKAGWNVISFTYLPNDKSVSNVMSGLTFGTDYNQISTWDSASGTWKHWLNDSQFNDFTEFQYGKTYEIYNNSGSDKTLSVTGITNGADLTHNIVSGDNFISPAVKTATNVTTVLAGLTQGTHYSDVKRFNATSQTWESYAGSAFTQFEPGKGYNIIGLTSASFSYGKTETTTTFVYDSAGQRVKKTVGGTTTTYLGKDYDVTGSTSTKYIFLGDRRISTKDSGGTLQFIHDDHISSSNVVTDASGNQAGLFEYDPYGSTVTHTGSADPKHKFTGQEEDGSTKLYNMGARLYDPQLGRFITPDSFIQKPSDPQSFNRYAYARNNPIRFTDPTGFNFWDKVKKIGKKIIANIVGATVFTLTFLATGNIGLSYATGTAAFRGTEAWLNGDGWKGIRNAAGNGFIEGFEIYRNPAKGINLYTRGPDTSHVSTGKFVQTSLMIFGVDDRTAKIIGSQLEHTTAAKNSEGNKVYDFFTGANYNLLEVAIGALGHSPLGGAPGVEGGPATFGYGLAKVIEANHQIYVENEYQTNQYLEFRGIVRLDYTKQVPGYSVIDTQRRVQKQREEIDLKNELIEKSGKWKG